MYVKRCRLSLLISKSALFNIWQTAIAPTIFNLKQMYLYTFLIHSLIQMCLLFFSIHTELYVTVITRGSKYQTDLLPVLKWTAPVTRVDNDGVVNGFYYWAVLIAPLVTCLWARAAVRYSCRCACRFDRCAWAPTLCGCSSAWTRAAPDTSRSRSDTTTVEDAAWYIRIIHTFIDFINHFSDHSSVFLSGMVLQFNDSTLNDMQINI